MRLLEAINEGANILKLRNIPNYILDSEILMSKTLNKEREYLILNKDLIINDNDYSNFIFLIKKRSSNVPVAYLTNYKNFWNCEFYVDNRVLIPRPDTEILLEEFFKIKKYKHINKFLEVGVGSGCLILSILNECNSLKGVGIDISGDALKVCKLNAKRLNLENRINLFKSDIDKFNYGKYDMIVSNPPYISKTKLKNLMKDVVNNEPVIALDGGLDGTSEIRKVIKKSSKLIKEKGILLLEIAHNQRFMVKRILKKYGFRVKKIVYDYSGYERCILSTKF